MSDLLSIGSSGVAAYQRALATVSNNIANVSTDGYNRQDVSITSNAPTQLGGSYLGTGARFDTVRRQYDAFVESNLRSSNSDLQAQTPMLSYVNRLIDIMGDENIGLTTAMNKFFESGRDVATDPASTVARSVFLRDADGLASRFRQLASQFDLLETETRQLIETKIGEANALTQQLALVNKQLSKNAVLDKQPSELVDQRDLLLRKLSGLTGIKTSFKVNGEVLVSVGDTISQGVLLDGEIARPIGQMGSFELEQINSLTSKLAETNRALNLKQSLAEQPKDLLLTRDNLLKELSQVASVNTSFETNGAVKVTLNDASQQLLVSGVRAKELASSNMMLVLDPYGKRESLPNLASGEMGGLLNFRNQVLDSAHSALDTLATTTANEVNTVHSQGLDLEGQIGTDLFSFDEMASGAAAGMFVAIRDTSRVAAAGQFRVIDDPLNAGTSQARIAYAKPLFEGPKGLVGTLGEAQVPAFRSETLSIGTERDYEPLGLIPMGMRDLTLTMQVPPAGQSLQIMTRDGRHLLGTSLLDASGKPSSLASLLMDRANGMEAGATYNADQLNANAPDRYLDMDLFMGVKAEEVLEQRFDSVTGNALAPSSTPASLTFDASKLSLSGTVEAGTFTLNGHAMPALTGTGAGGAVTLSDLEAWINAESGTTQVSATLSGDTLTLTRTDSATDPHADIRLGFGSKGEPSSLKALGFDTAVYIKGTAKDDLLVFVTTDTPSTTTFTSQFAGISGDMQQALRQQSLQVRFMNEADPAGGADKLWYEIKDQNSNTVLAKREFITGTGTPTLNYRGLKLDFSTAPKAGDKFTVDGNTDGVGNNEAILQLVNIEKKPLVGNLTLTESYIESVNQVGNVSRQATISQQALTVVHQQAQEARDGISGVSLDEEASALVRYQQAYQANAKVMQVASQLFEAILQVR